MSGEKDKPEYRGEPRAKLKLRDEV